MRPRIVHALIKTNPRNIAAHVRLKTYSQLDSALLIQSIGITSLVLVLDEEKHRRLAFKAAVVLYLLALLDMGVNVLISGVVGWKS
jgi:hypothetical protein